MQSSKAPNQTQLSQSLSGELFWVHISSFPNIRHFPFPTCQVLLTFFFFYNIFFICHIYFHVMFIFPRLGYCSSLLADLRELHSCHIHFPKHNSSRVQLKKLCLGENVEKDVQKNFPRTKSGHIYWSKSLYFLKIRF